MIKKNMLFAGWLALVSSFIFPFITLVQGHLAIFPGAGRVKKEDDSVGGS
jgi:hypothetical protein